MVKNSSLQWLFYFAQESGTVLRTRKIICHPAILCYNVRDLQKSEDLEIKPMNDNTKRGTSRRKGGQNGRGNVRRGIGSDGFEVRRDENGSSQAPSGVYSERRARSRRPGFSSQTVIMLVILSLLAGIWLTLGIMKFRQRGASSASASAAQETLDGIRESLSEGNSVLSTLRKFYKDDLILYADKRYIFTPVDDSLKKHAYVSDKVNKLENGEWEYLEDGKAVSHKGIDVSSHQGEIRWDEVAASGVEYAIIRAMYRGYSSGKLVEDTQFQANAAGASANGIRIGAYVFTQAISREEVEEEVEMLKGLLAQHDISGPVVVDVEQTAEGTGRMDEIDPGLRTELVAYYCDLIKEAGYRPMIYFNIETALLLLDLKELEPYEKWFASYSSEFYYPYAYALWQYSDKGKVPGIDTDVDLDISFEAF